MGRPQAPDVDPKPAPADSSTKTKIATKITKAIGAQCVSGTIAPKADGSPDCDVTQRQYDAAQKAVDTAVPFCGDGTHLADSSADSPCWRFAMAQQCPGGSQLLQVCYDPACMSKPQNMTDALVACAIQP